MRCPWRKKSSSLLLVKLFCLWMCFSHSLLGVKVILVMCILFLHTDNSPAPNKFRLILASNRDEYYRRPTQQAHFWDEDHTVIGGTVQVRPENFRHSTVLHFPVNSFFCYWKLFSQKHGSPISLLKNINIHDLFKW